MRLRFLGYIFIIWGLAMPVMLWWSAANDERIGTGHLVFGGIICIIWLIVGCLLVRRRERNLPPDIYNVRYR